MRKPINCKKFLAVAVLVALLASSVSVLAESLSAAGLPSCCSSTYCPMHQGQFRKVQKEMSDCDTNHHGPQSSMQACDSTPKPAMQAAPFVVPVPVAIHMEAVPQDAPALKARFSPFAVRFLLTPPPRLLPS